MRKTVRVAVITLLALAFFVGGTASTGTAQAASKPASGTSEGGSLASWRKAMVANGWQRLGHPVEGPNGKVHRYCYINTTPNITFLLCYDGYRDVS